MKSLIRYCTIQIFRAGYIQIYQVASVIYKGATLSSESLDSPNLVNYSNALCRPTSSSEGGAMQWFNPSLSTCSSKRLRWQSLVFLSGEAGADSLCEVQIAFSFWSRMRFHCWLRCFPRLPSRIDSAVAQNVPVCSATEDVNVDWHSSSLNFRNLKRYIIILRISCQTCLFYDCDSGAISLIFSEEGRIPSFVISLQYG